MPEQDGRGPSRAVTAAGRYHALEYGERDKFLRRAREAARLTIPTLLPPEGNNGDDLEDPFQSVGARGVNNLAAKLLLALFPPGSTGFFRFVVDPIQRAQLEQTIQQSSPGIDPEQIPVAIEEALSAMERSVVGKLEQKGVRTTLFEALKHLLVSGNVCLEILDDGAARLHFLDRYVVKRDTAGNVLEIIIKTRVSREALPPEVRQWVEAAEIDTSTDLDMDDPDNADPVDLYTWYRREGGKWKIHQEVGGRIIPGTEGEDPLDKPRIHALRTTKIDGEDYGRGYVDDYIGDLKTLEGLSQAIVEGAAAAAKILVFVTPTADVTPEEVAKSPSGAVFSGDAKDVSILQMEKYADFTVAENVSSRIEKRLEQAFLLFSGIQRQAERVTAEEIRTVAQELEQTLGGLYSILAQELQRPLVDRLVFQMQRKGEFPALPEESIQPQIVAGLEGLSRSSDLSKRRAWAEIMQQVYGPEWLARFTNPEAMASAFASDLGIDIDGIMKSPEQIQAEREQEQSAAIAEKATPAAIQAATEIATRTTEGNVSSAA